MKNDWNKYIYPNTFQGFIDATYHNLSSSEINAANEDRISTSAQLSKQAKFDGKIIDAKYCIDTSYPDHVWQEVPYQHFKNHLAANEAIKHNQIYIAVNADELPNSAAINRCAELFEHFISIDNNRIRLLLKNMFQICPNKLLKIVRMAELSGVQRICFADDLSLFSPSGVKRFIEVLNSMNNSHTLAFECAFSGKSEHTKSNAIMAIDAGINYIHVSACYLEQGGKALPITQLMQEFNTYNFHLNTMELQKYILYCHQFNLENVQFPACILTSLTKQAQTPVENGKELTNTNRLPLNNIFKNITLRFEVSANDWHVKIQLVINGIIEDLGERVHHYVILLLAREYYQQYQGITSKNESLDPLLIGWLEREALHQMIGDNEAQFNVKLCRARKHIISAAEKLGVNDFQPLSTRQGSVRLNCGNIIVVRGSRVEFEMKNWLIIANNEHELKSA